MNKDEPVLDRKQQLIIVISVAMSSFMAGLNNYIVNVSLPTISNYFNASIAEVSRVVLSYLLIITSSLLLFGRLGDKLGLKRIFIIGYTVFTAGSFLCGLSGSINMLVGFRLLQGIGSAMLTASGFAIISKYLPADRIGHAFGIMSTSVALGIIAGAPLGGLITGYLSWHWIFFVNVPIGITAIITGNRCIPGETAMKPSLEEKNKGFDIPGAILSFFGLAALLYGINTGKTMGWTSPSILIFFASSIVLLTLFVARELKCSSPLLDFRLFKNSTFTCALLTAFMAFMLVSGNTFLLPFYLEIIKQLSIQQTSMVLLAYAVIHAFLSPYAGRLSDRLSPHKLCAVGMASASLSTFVFAYTLRLNGLVFVFVFLIWVALSYVLFFAPNSKQVMRLAIPGEHGTASGLLNTIGFLGMIFGVAIFETVFSHAFSEVLPKGVSIARAGIPPLLLLRGFSNAYIFGGIVCFLAFLFSLAGRDSKV